MDCLCNCPKRSHDGRRQHTETPDKIKVRKEKKYEKKKSHSSLLYQLYRPKPNQFYFPAVRTSKISIENNTEISPFEVEETHRNRVVMFTLSS